MKGPLHKAFGAIASRRLKADRNVLAAAIKRGDAARVEMFLEKFPDAAGWKFGTLEYTCIHTAAHAGQWGLIPLFQRYGADIDAPCYGGYPALALAQKEDQVAQMLALGAKLHDGRWTGMTPLMRAIVNGGYKKACALIDAGTDLAIRDSNGWTALMHASSFTPHWHPRIVGNPWQGYMAEYILTKPGIPDEELEVCLKLASRCKESEVAANALEKEIGRREGLRAAARAEKQAMIDAYGTGTTQKTAVRRPLVLKKQ